MPAVGNSQKGAPENWPLFYGLIFYLDFGRGYTSAYTCQNSLNRTFKICEFYRTLNVSVVQIN